MTFDSVNPTTGERLETFEALEPQEIDQALERSREAFGAWRMSTFSERAELLHALSDRLLAEKQQHAELMALEMGKPLAQGGVECERCAALCAFYARYGEDFLGREAVETPSVEGFVCFEPLGPVLAIMPWTLPYWQVFRFAAPALMAGNVVLLKHASNVLGCARAIEHVLLRSGAPAGLLQSLVISGTQALGLIAEPGVKAVTLAGSEAAARSVAESAGRAHKKALLELGGSDPFVVLEDADVEVVVRHALAARTLDAGPRCMAAEHFIVASPIRDRFAEALASELATLPVGDPLEPETRVGPLARANLRVHLERVVEESLAAGARRVKGGHALAGEGFFYAPTLLCDVRPGMPAFDEESFGPLAAVVDAKSDEQAVELANRSRFGPGVSVWTADSDRVRSLVPALDAERVAINGLAESAPGRPFEGIENSAAGRALGRLGIRELVNVKSVWIGPPATAGREGGER